MSKKQTIEDLCNKVADIKYELQQVLDTLYKLENDFETVDMEAQRHFEEKMELQKEIHRLLTSNTQNT